VGVLAVLVRFPFARSCPLAVLAAPYRDPAEDRRAKRRHRTPARQAIRMLRLMLHRFPGRRFVFVGDSACEKHELAWFVDRSRARLALVSKLRPEGDLFEPPPSGQGARRPKPRLAVEATPQRRRMTASWHGGGTRRVETADDSGHWFKGGDGLVPIRWSFVRDRDGTHRHEYSYETNPKFVVWRDVETYAGHWSIETTFQEAHSEVHVQTTRGRSRPAIPRRPVPVRAELGRGVALRLSATRTSGRRRRLAGQGGHHVLRRPVGRPPLNPGRGVLGSIERPHTQAR
jgi:hypothetical protein